MQTRKIICLLVFVLVVFLAAGPMARIAAASTLNVVMSPKNGEQWRQTASYSILWSGPPVVSIFLLKDGALFREIYRGGAAPQNGLWLYLWKIGTDVPLGSYQIKVQQLDVPAVSMTSPAFWITAAKTEVAITNINYRYFKAGTPATFKWRYSAIPTPAMRLASFTMHDNKSGLNYLLATFPLNGKAASNSPDGFGEATATIPANIPAIQDGTLVMNIFAPGLPDVISVSEPYFRIEAAGVKPEYQGITLLSPIEGAKLYQGTTNTITWKYDPNLSGTVSVSIINGQTIASHIPIGAGGQGSCEWKIGYASVPLSYGTLVVRHDTMNPVVSSKQVNVTVVPPKEPYIITSPAAGSFLEPGQKFQIKWQPKPGIAPSKTVQIDLSGNGGGYIFTYSQPVNADGSGSLDTQLPLTVHNVTVAGPMKITIYNNDCAFANSEVAFNVHPAPTISLTSPAPNSGTKWFKGQTRTITWNYTGYKPGLKADIMLKWTGGSRVIASGLVMPGTGGQGSYEWTIPTGLETRTDYQIQVCYGGEGRGGAAGTREVTSSAVIAIGLMIQRPPILNTLP